MTPSERRALHFLAAVALLGGGVRAVGASRGAAARSRDAGDQPALAAQLVAAESAAASSRTSGGRKPAASKGGSRARASSSTGVGVTRRAAASADGGSGAPAAAAEPARPVDLDRADAAALDALPGIGPVLAARIVADRDSLGPFGSLDRLQRVRGIGAAMTRRLAPHVTFSGTPRPLSAVPARPRGARPAPRRRGRAAPVSSSQAGPFTGPPVLPTTSARPPPTWPFPLPQHPSAWATC